MLTLIVIPEAVSCHSRCVFTRLRTIYIVFQKSFYYFFAGKVRRYFLNIISVFNFNYLKRFLETLFVIVWNIFGLFL